MTGAFALAVGLSLFPPPQPASASAPASARTPTNRTATRLVDHVSRRAQERLRASFGNTLKPRGVRTDGPGKWRLPSCRCQRLDIRPRLRITCRARRTPVGLRGRGTQVVWGESHLSDVKRKLFQR